MQITRTRGDTVPDICTVSTVGTGMVTNITGCKFVMTVSRVPNPVDTTTQVFQLVGVIVDAPAGIVQFQPTLQQADNVGYFYYDIQMTDSYGRDFTLVKDTYVFTQDITK